MVEKMLLNVFSKNIWYSLKLIWKELDKLDMDLDIGYIKFLLCVLIDKI